RVPLLYGGKAVAIACRGRKLSTTLWCIAQYGSFLGLVVFERRLTRIHHNGVELEGTPLPHRLERAVPGPQGRVRVPAVQLFLEELLVIAFEELCELVLVFDINQVHGVLLVEGSGRPGRLGDRESGTAATPSPHWRAPEGEARANGAAGARCNGRRTRGGSPSGDGGRIPTRRLGTPPVPCGPTAR